MRDTGSLRPFLKAAEFHRGLVSLWMNSRKESFQDVLLISMITTENCFDLTAKFLLVDPAVVFGGGDRAARWIASRW